MIFIKAYTVGPHENGNLHDFISKILPVKLRNNLTKYAFIYDE